MNGDPPRIAKARGVGWARVLGAAVVGCVLALLGSQNVAGQDLLIEKARGNPVRGLAWTAWKGEVWAQSP